MKPLVIDISHHNTVTSFERIRAAGIIGVIHKATQGSAMIDGKYASRRKLALDAGLLWGAYHFNDGTDAYAQLQHFFSVARPDPNTLMALDFEDNPKSNMSVGQARDFLSLGDSLLGRKLVLYGGNRIKEHVLKSDKFFAEHRLWLCQYGPKAVVPKPWKSYWLWQYAADGAGPQPHHCDGIEGIPDMNTSELSEDELRATWA